MPLDQEQHPYQLFIGRRKSQRCQIRSPDPPHFLTQKRPRRLPQHAVVEKQCDRSIGVSVCRVEDEIPHVDVRIELLAHFATQRVGVAFSRIDLAAGEFPQPREVHALRTSCHEKRVVLFDDGGDDDNRWGAHQSMIDWSNTSINH